jgi:hypothetical protein
VLEAGGTLGGVDHLLRDLAYVQPRWESEVSPRRRYVCLYRAIAMLLTMKAADVRLSLATRQRAEVEVMNMTGSDAFICGLAGDYGEVCSHFLLRKFDIKDHDPARTQAELQFFLKTARFLFTLGYIVCLPEGQGRHTDRGRQAAGLMNVPGIGPLKTLSQIALEQVQDETEFRCAGVFET